MREEELIIYKEFADGDILRDVVWLMEHYRAGDGRARPLFYRCMHRLSEQAADHGFYGNLWHCLILFVHLAIPIGTFNEDNLLFLTIHLIDHLDSYIIRPFLLTKNIAIFIEVILFTQISLGIVSIINPIMIHIFIISNLDRNITG